MIKYTLLIPLTCVTFMNSWCKMDKCKVLVQVESDKYPKVTNIFQICHEWEHNLKP